MLILPVRTPLLSPGSDIAGAIIAAGAQPRDIMVVSSKAMATIEGSIVSLNDVTPSMEAQGYGEKTGLQPHFCEAVLRETTYRNGSVRGHCPFAILTELQPTGMTGSILAANAGMDKSNTAAGTAIGWPKDPVTSARMLRDALGGTVAVIVSDSCCVPRRDGVSAYALAVAGMDPIIDEKGHADLFGKPLSITKEARADQLATAANVLMGNADQSCPAAIIRDHGCAMTDFAGWVPGMPREKDLFTGLL